MKTQLLLVTGWAHTGDSLRPLSVALRERAESLLLEPSDLPPPRSYADELATIIRQASQPCVIVGWSMGGTIALETAIRSPDGVRGLVLLNSSARFCSATGYAGTDPRTVQTMGIALRRNPEKVLGDFLKAAADPYTVEDLEVRVADANALGFPELSRGLDYLEQTDLRPCLKEIDLPVLLLHGEKDKIIPAGASQVLANGIRHGTLELHPDAGHDLPLRFPGYVADRITNFLGALK